MHRTKRISLSLVVVSSTAYCTLATDARAVDGGTLRIAPASGWQAFEVITQADDPTGDGFSYAMPGIFDGAGAWPVGTDISSDPPGAEQWGEPEDEHQEGRTP